MSGYFDSAYIAKCYVNEADSGRVRALASRLGGATSSALCVAELATLLLRHEREGALDRLQATRLRIDFAADLTRGVWVMLPLSDGLMTRVAARVASLPSTAYVRAGDAIHLCAAIEAGFAEVWTNDRHMLAAAPLFGLAGRTA